MATKKAKVLDDFTDVPAAKKMEQSQVKHDKIDKAVIVFITPDVDMMAYQKHIENATNLIEIVDGGDKSRTKEKNDAITQVDDDNRMLALYVTRISNGSEAIIQLAGFTPTKTVTTKAKVPEQSVIKGGPGKLVGGVSIESDILEFAVRYTFVVGKDLNNVTFDNGNVVINSPIAVDGVIPASYPVVVRTTKLNKAVVNNLTSREDYQCICFGTSTAGSGKPSATIIVKSF